MLWSREEAHHVHVPARDFQAAPSCKMTLIYVPVTCSPPASTAQGAGLMERFWVLHVRLCDRQNHILEFLLDHLIVVATAVLQQRSPLIEIATAAMPSLEEFYAAADLNRLSAQDIEDHSLVYPTETTRQLNPQ
jgi:hypothetical protein